MAMKYKQLLWQIPVIVLISVAASLVAVWVVSRIFGFNMDASLVAILSTAISASLSSAIIISKKSGKS